MKSANIIKKSALVEHMHACMLFYKTVKLCPMSILRALYLQPLPSVADRGRPQAFRHHQQISQVCSATVSRLLCSSPPILPVI